MLKRSLSGLGMSLAEIAIGILLLVDPVGFTSGIVIALGVVLMIMGAVSAIKYFLTSPETAAADQTLAKGLTMLLAGAFCAFNSQWFIVTFPVLTLIYGVVVLLAGIKKLQWTVDMLRMKCGKWYLGAISAVVSVVCGILIITGPFSTTAVLWTFIGVSLIVEAVLDLLSSIFSSREKREPVVFEEEVQ